jgi:hypothetical protein
MRSTVAEPLALSIGPQVSGTLPGNTPSPGARRLLKPDHVHMDICEGLERHVMHEP